MAVYLATTAIMTTCRSLQTGTLTKDDIDKIDQSARHQADKVAETLKEMK